MMWPSEPFMSSLLDNLLMRNGAALTCRGFGYPQRRIDDCSKLLIVLTLRIFF